MVIQSWMHYFDAKCMKYFDSIAELDIAISERCKYILANVLQIGRGCIASGATARLTLWGAS